MVTAKQPEAFTLQGTLLKVTEWERRFGVCAGFSTKNGGVGTGHFTSMNLSYTVGDSSTVVLSNRRLLAEKTDVPYNQWVFAQQQHTNNIAEVTNADCGAGVFEDGTAIAQTDGMYTSEKGIMLATFHADCTPIYFYSPKHEMIGLVHAGWQGTAKEIMRIFIKKWQKRGVNPTDIYIAFGPAASQALYEVDERVVKQIQLMDLARLEEALIAKDNNKYLLDTAYLNYLAAIHLGVPAANIMRSAYCTIKEKELFFSYRRSGQTGRMLAFINQ